ncbi:MAG: hypothetical protein K0R90_911 [Oscillospiraceae bacterium]|jgi:hypothetical protein|nr:hypothetical protein [Oscillospiraceae bacterium]
MDWHTLYNQDNPPSVEETSQFVGNPLWENLNDYIQSAYQLKPKFSYSKCSAQPGWNVKYQKSGKSLCTLYPMQGYFIALVVIGEKETQDTELLLPSLSVNVQELYQRTSFLCGGRWLMIDVTDKQTLKDVICLINIRVKPKIKV